MKMKIRAGALQYTVFLSFVVAALLLMFLLYRGMRMKYVESELAFYKKTSDLNSALTLYLTYPSRYQISDSVSIDIHGDSASIVHISRSSWGILDVVEAKISYRKTGIVKTVIIGKDPFRSDSLALILPDNSQPVYVSGNTIIAGNIKISDKGIQKASIEGKPLTTERIPDGRSIPGERNLFGLNKRLVNNIISWQNDTPHPARTIRLNAIDDPVMVHKNLSSPLAYVNNDSYQLSGLTTIGAIAFFSGGTIHVSKDAQLEGVIVSAGNVVIADGFEGSLQVICRDSIIVGKGCHLEYPSALVVYNEAVNPVYIEMGESSLLDGMIICMQTETSNRPPYLKIGENAGITGLVYHNGTIELLGKIFGSLACQSFYLQTRRAYYINHLLDNEINFLKLPRDFVGIDFKNGYNDQIIAIILEGFEKVE